MSVRRAELSRLITSLDRKILRAREAGREEQAKAIERIRDERIEEWRRAS